MGLAGLLASPACSSEAPKPSAPEPIRIGVSLGLSGPIAGLATPLRDAIRVAEGQINSAGGVLGRPLVFDVQDDRSDETAGIVERVARGFVAEGVVAVIGPLGSEQVTKTQDIYAKARVLQISPAATSPLLSTIQSKDQRWLFRTTPNDALQGKAVVDLVERTPGALSGNPGTTCTKLAIVNVDNAYGNAMADVIEQNFGAPQNVRRTKLSVTLAPNYKEAASALLDWKPGCLALLLYDDVAAQFVRDFKTVRPSSYAELTAAGFFFVATDSSYTDQFIERGRDVTSDPSSPNVVEGVYGTAPDTQPGTVQYNQLKNIYASYFRLAADGELPPYAANTYDAAMLIALALQRAGTTEPTAVRNALFAVANPPGKTYGPAELVDAMQAIAEGLDIDYTGASGNVDIDANGDVESGYAVWQVFRRPDKTVDFRTIGRISLDDLARVK